MPELRRHAIDIREALPEDGAALMQAIEQINQETEFLGKPEERLPWADRAGETIREMRARGSGIYLLALRGAEIVGFLGGFAGWLQRIRGVIFIGHVGLRQAERGRGIGRQLFIALEAWARQRGAYRLELRVDTENTRGLALYTRREFAIEGRIADAALVDGRWHAHFWMAKPLDLGREPPMPPVDLTPPAERSDAGRLQFRRIEVADARALCAWERQLLGETALLLKRPTEVMDEAKMAGYLAETQNLDERLLWAAIDEQRIVAHLSAWRQPGLRMRHDAFFSINVLRDHWGIGIGRALFDRLLAWAAERKLRRISTAVQRHNVRGLRFAKALGFVEEVVSPRYAVLDGQAVERVQLGKVL